MTITSVRKRERVYTWDHTRLRDAREGAGLGVAEMAAAIDAHQSTYGNWEAGRFEPPVGKLARICSVVGLPPAFFFVTRTLAGE